MSFLQTLIFRQHKSYDFLCDKATDYISGLFRLSVIIVFFPFCLFFSFLREDMTVRKACHNHVSGYIKTKSLSRFRQVIYDYLLHTQRKTQYKTLKQVDTSNVEAKVFESVLLRKRRFALILLHLYAFDEKKLSKCCFAEIRKTFFHFKLDSHSCQLMLMKSKTWHGLSNAPLLPPRKTTCVSDPSSMVLYCFTTSA